MIKLVRLDELAKIQIGKTPKRAVNEYWGAGFPWVSIADMKTEVITQTKEQITELAIKECGCKLIPKGSLIMSFKLSVGKLAFAGTNLFTNEAICAILIKEQMKIDPRYFYYALKNTKLTGSNMAVMGHTLNTESLNSLKIPVIEKLSDQIRIAGILSQAESLIAQRKQSISLLDELLKSTFLEMFGDPVRNEKGWEQESLENYATKISSGSTPLGGKEVYQRTGVYFIRSQNVRMNFLDYSEMYCISDEIHDKMKRTWIKNEDVLLNITGASIGRVATYYGEDDNANVNQHVCIIRTIKEKLNPRFLEYQISEDHFQAVSIASSTGGTRESFTFEMIKKFKIIIPPIALQTKFANMVEKVEALKSQYQQSLTELQNMYGVLSQKAFKGELGVDKKKLKEKV